MPLKLIARNKAACSASMKSANVDPYTKCSKDEKGVDPRIFAREGRGVETSSPC